MSSGWKDGSSDWVALKDLKESYPVELAIYATNRSIEDEPAFAWWVPYILKKQKRILKKVNSKLKILREDSQIWNTHTKEYQGSHPN